MPAAPLPEAELLPEDPPPDELELLITERASLAGVKGAALARALAFQRPTNARPKGICGCVQFRWRSTPEEVQPFLSFADDTL